MIQRIFGFLTLVSVAGACDAKTISTPLGSGVIRTRTTSLRVGDTVTVEAGVLYRDGRFVPFASPIYSTLTPAVATVHSNTGLVRGIAAGTAQIVATQQGLAVIDTLFTVTP
ncbi:MAG: Ig-like domain-containing protein [Gemmatimonadaceae bacterium]